MPRLGRTDESSWTRNAFSVTARKAKPALYVSLFLFLSTFFSIWNFNFILWRRYFCLIQDRSRRDSSRDRRPGGRKDSPRRRSRSPVRGRDDRAGYRGGGSGGRFNRRNSPGPSFRRRRSPTPTKFRSSGGASGRRSSSRSRRHWSPHSSLTGGVFFITLSVFSFFYQKYSISSSFSPLSLLNGRP